MPPTPPLHQKPIQQWPRKKRVLVSAGISGFILVSALVLGSGIYWLGRVVGVFAPFDLYAEVTTRALNDPELLWAYTQARQTQSCTNEVWGYRYRYETPLQVTLAEGEEKCSELTYPTATETGYLKIARETAALGTVIEQTVAQFAQVETDSYSHPVYEATMIRGLDEEMPVMIVVIKASEALSYTVSVFPEEKQLEDQVEQTIRSLRVW